MNAVPLLPFEIEALVKDPNRIVWTDPERVIATLEKQQRDLVNMNELLKQNSPNMTLEYANRIEETNRRIQQDRDVAHGLSRRFATGIVAYWTFDEDLDYCRYCTERPCTLTEGHAEGCIVPVAAALDNPSAGVITLKLPSGESGQGLAEYALILALVVIVCLVLLSIIGTPILGWLDEIGKRL